MRTPAAVAAVGALFGAVALLAAAAADAGWIVVDDNGDQTLISQGRLKMSPRRAEDTSMVLDLARGRMWIADFARGWPLKAVYHGEGGATARTLVTRVERREIPERDFTPPVGFRPGPLVEILAQKR
jgi:hypothetical protein